MTKRGLPLYPFLAALYPVLDLAARNGGDLVRPRDLLIPSTISLAAALVAWFLAGGVTRDADRRAFLAFVAVGVFSAYGCAVETLRAWGASDVVASIVLLVPIAAAAVLSRRSRVAFGPLTRYLNVVLAMLTAWSSATYLWRSRPQPVVRVSLPAIPSQSVAGSDSTHDSRPHFFLIILDKYTGHRSLIKNYGFDNTPFEQMLEAEGFVIPRAPRANYIHTFLALPALLNWEYLDDITNQLGRQSTNREPMNLLTEDNRTWRALHPLGYRFIFFPSALFPTERNRYADMNVPDPSLLRREFAAVWLRATMLPPLLEGACAFGICPVDVFPYSPESAQSLDDKFDAIPGFAQSEQPAFVLAHMMVPHEPYVYDANCRHRTPYWPRTDASPEEAQMKAAYVAQLRCVNRKVEALVRAIKAKSRRATIILLQADHGHGRLGRAAPPLSAVSAAQVKERTDIFEAYLLPGAPLGLVDDSMGPVNAMRAVMRYYYGLDLPRLPEMSYWSSWDQPYDLTKVR
jgi:hypothetical protein